MGVEQTADLVEGGAAPQIDEEQDVLGVEQTADLVEGGAAPQIDEEQDVLGIVEGSDRLFHLLAEVVRTHARNKTSSGSSKEATASSTFWRKSSGPMLGMRETVATLGWSPKTIEPVILRPSAKSPWLAKTILTITQPPLLLHVLNTTRVMVCRSSALNNPSSNCGNSAYSQLDGSFI